MAIQDAQQIVRDANLNITPQKVNECYVISLASRIDTVKDMAVAQ